MEYSCGKFGDYSFSRFGSIVRTNKHTQTLVNALLSRLSSACVDKLLIANYVWQYKRYTKTALCK